jgi:hypothetical protein
VDNKDQKNQYLLKLAEFETMRMHFTALKKNGFKDKFPEKYKQGMWLLMKLEEELYFWKRRIDIFEKNRVFN